MGLGCEKYSDQLARWLWLFIRNIATPHLPAPPHSQCPQADRWRKTTAPKKYPTGCLLRPAASYFYPTVHRQSALRRAGSGRSDVLSAQSPSECPLSSEGRRHLRSRPKQRNDLEALKNFGSNTWSTRGTTVVIRVGVWSLKLRSSLPSRSISMTRSTPVLANCHFRPLSRRSNRPVGPLLVMLNPNCHKNQSDRSRRHCSADFS